MFFCVFTHQLYFLQDGCLFFWPSSTRAFLFRAISHLFPGLNDHFPSSSLLSAIALERCVASLVSGGSRLLYFLMLVFFNLVSSQCQLYFLHPTGQFSFLTKSQFLTRGTATTFWGDKLLGVCLE